MAFMSVLICSRPFVFEIKYYVRLDKTFNVIFSSIHCVFSRCLKVSTGVYLLCVGEQFAVQFVMHAAAVSKRPPCQMQWPNAISFLTYIVFMLATGVNIICFNLERFPPLQVMFYFYQFQIHFLEL